MTTQDTTIALRRCIGSSRSGIEAHEAQASDFPVQPSQTDGLGRRCRSHWTEYTRGLRKAALARKAAEVPEAGPATEPVAEPEAPRRSRRARAMGEPQAAEAAAG